MKFFQTIDNSFIGRLVQSKLNIIAHTDPNRIYVENIRSFYNIPFPIAKLLCEMAVKQRFFLKKYAVECPNEGRIIRVYNSKAEIPEIIHCDSCEALENEKYDFERRECEIKEFYKLNTR